MPHPSRHSTRPNRSCYGGMATQRCPACDRGKNVTSSSRWLPRGGAATLWSARCASTQPRCFKVDSTTGAGTHDRRATQSMQNHGIHSRGRQPHQHIQIAPGPKGHWTLQSTQTVAASTAATSSSTPRATAMMLVQACLVLIVPFMLRHMPSCPRPPIRQSLFRFRHIHSGILALGCSGLGCAALALVRCNAAIAGCRPCRALHKG